MLATTSHQRRKSAPRSDADAGLVTTGSGLVVPQTAVERRHRTMLADDFNRLRRAIVSAQKDHGITLVTMCGGCKQPIGLRLVESINPEKPGGTPFLQCACTDWTVR